MCTGPPGNRMNTWAQCMPAPIHNCVNIVQQSPRIRSYNLACVQVCKCVLERIRAFSELQFNVSTNNSHIKRIHAHTRQPESTSHHTQCACKCALALAQDYCCSVGSDGGGGAKCHTPSQNVVMQIMIGGAKSARVIFHNVASSCTPRATAPRSREYCHHICITNGIWRCGEYNVGRVCEG